MVLADGRYSWRTRTVDGWAWGPHAGWCEFEVDTQRPGQPSVVSSMYPKDQVGGAVGQPGTFTLGKGPTPDVVGYSWALNSDARPAGGPMRTVPLGGSTDVTVTPTTSGPQTLRVWSFDRANNVSDASRYDFRVNPVGQLAAWNFDEGIGTSASNAAGTVRAAGTAVLSLTNGAGWTGGHQDWADAADRAVRLDGVDDDASGANAGVQPDKSFTVSAWVRADTFDRSMTAVSQDSTGPSAYALGYDHATGSWVFGRPQNADPANPSWLYARHAAEAPYTGDWIHLVGVYDQPTGRLSIFVNNTSDEQLGLPSSSVFSTGPFHGTNGTLRVGRNGGPCAVVCGTQHWAGDVDELRLFQGAADAALVDKLFFHQRGEQL